MTARSRPSGLQVVDQEIIQNAVQRIVGEFNPIRIVVFGSAARGEAGPDSDLDLFVEMESDERFIDRCVAVRLALRNLPVALDVFVYTPREIAERRGRAGDLLSYVDREGKVVYERR